ncbi:MAG: hypothetical protein QM703_20585 [Gemmatales bacterium]
MSFSDNSLHLSWDEQEKFRRSQLKSRVWKETKTILNWILVVLVVVLGISVMIMKFSHEPGIHLQLFNESGQCLSDVRLKFSWSEYLLPDLPAEPRKSWHKPYGAIIRKVVWMDDKASVLTVDWTDAKGVKHQHVEKDMYLTGDSEQITIKFNADGSVTIKYKGLGFF